MPNPNAPARAVFLRAVLARPEVESALAPEEVDAVAAATEGFSGSDMACLCRQAAMAPVRELLAAARGGRARAGKRRRLTQQGGAGAGGSGGCGARSGSGGGAAAMVVRGLVAADFEAALATIRPAAADAAG